jgi:hypothetical protein
MSDDGENPEIASRRICCDCVQESFLRAEILKTGEKAECYYCQSMQKTISIGELAGDIGAAFDQHYVKTATDPSAYEYALQKDGLWHRAGDPVVYAISEAAEIEEEPAEDIRQILDNRNYDQELAEMGEECPFEEDAHYEFQGINDIEFQLEWAAFEHAIQTKSRFFSQTARLALDMIFGDMAQFQTTDDQPVVVEAGPDGVVKSLFRARPFQSLDELRKAIERPDLGLGSPPSRKATAGRMNPQGIAVFYGAEAENAAIAEVRPPVGGHVAVGRFDIIRSLRLLDVKALQEVFALGSIFESDSIQRLEHAKFLESLAARFSSPVMPGDESFDYLITQAIAEYLSEIPDPRLDGFIYPSVQVGTRERNVVLFQHAARVTEMEPPKGTVLTVHDGYNTEDGYEIDFAVSEHVPPSESKNQKDRTDQRHDIFFSMMVFSSPFDALKDDMRQVSLELDLESVAVHHIKSVRHETSRQLVSRHRRVKG